MGKPRETEHRLVVAKGWGGERAGEQLPNGSRASLGVMKMFWKFIDVVVTQHCECTQCHGIVYFQMIRFYVR